MIDVLYFNKEEVAYGLEHLYFGGTLTTPVWTFDSGSLLFLHESMAALSHGFEQLNIFPLKEVRSNQHVLHFVIDEKLLH